ncbi:hypothetical protein MO973_21005 [Paenibacillus sp. TRM 82003]|nr:hypothetical protein [Paenibacillus sp. TRM 82003]
MQGIQLVSLNYTNIYEIRSETSIPTVMGYLITWQYRIINPFFILIFYLKRKYAVSAAFVFIQFVLFFIYPHKEIIYCLAIIFLVLFIERKRYKFDLSLVGGLCLGIPFAAVIYYLFSKVFFLATIVRLLYVPAIIKFQHYLFFSEADKLYYSEGIIGKLLGFDYPYPVASGYLVGNPDNNDNTGYLAYAYDNAGFLGMIAISLIFIALLNLIDSLVKNENKTVIFSFLVYPMIMLNDGDLLTLLLTGGLFFFLILLFVYKDISTSKIFRRNQNGG